MADVVSDVCGVQAQVLSAAELALRARIEGLQQEDVHEALWGKHTILKTWGMRGTLHLLPSSEFPLYIAALRLKLQRSMSWLQKDGGIKPAEAETVSRVIGKVLLGRTLTREDLANEVERRAKLERRTRDYLMSAWGVMLRPAAYQGNLAFGENIGSKVTFVNPRDWIRTWDEPTPRNAFAELFRKFLGSYGPTKPSEFAHWWGDIRSGHDDLRPLAEGFEEVEFDGSKGLLPQKGAEEAKGLGPVNRVNLLPSFDCYAMFYSPRDYFVSGTHRNRVFRQTAGWNYPTVVIDGTAAGIWSLKNRGRRIEVSVEGFRAFETQEKKGIAEEAEDLGRFYGAHAELIYRAI